jgi:hypothetical protein
VFDVDRGGPGIISERDLLGSNGRGEDIDRERARDHLTSRLVYVLSRAEAVSACPASSS